MTYLNDPQYIILHCSDSPSGRGDDASTIHRWHCERGWAGIGYHRVILEDGSVQNGRPDYWIGAHAVGYNENSIAICRIGKGDDASAEQINGIVKEMCKIREKYNIPVVNILGHCETEQAGGKTCPDLDMNMIRQLVRDKIKDIV